MGSKQSMGEVGNQGNMETNVFCVFFPTMKPVSGVASTQNNRLMV